MNRPKVYFIGIGGIGTSALARWFLSQGYNVSGSDASSSEIISQLKKEGVKVFIGHREKNVPWDAKLVIFSAAVPPTNPELVRARQLGIPAKSYAEAVAGLTKQYKTLAVAGAHGKSTTTALLSLVLIKAGFDPTVIIGTKLKEFRNSNFRKGKSQYLILEADEYQESFLNYSPIAAIILNIDAEHLDYYKNLANIKKSFLKFIANIRPDGILVLNKDDENLFNLKNKIQKITKKRNIKIFWYGIRSKPPIYRHFAAFLKIAGEHNISNALAAYTLAKALKIKDKDIFNTISSYRGAWRRLEYKGIFKVKGQKSIANCQVYDDYAHHPTEIKATLAGIAQKWPKTSLICVFQPHQAKRLSLLFKAFVKAFDSANALVLLPIYQVTGRDKVSQNVSSKKLAQEIKKRILKLKPSTINLKTVEYLPSPQKLPKVIKEIITEKFLYPKPSTLNAIIVMMGAGDIYKYTDSLIQ